MKIESSNNNIIDKKPLPVKNFSLKVNEPVKDIFKKDSLNINDVKSVSEKPFGEPNNTKVSTPSLIPFVQNDIDISLNNNQIKLNLKAFEKINESDTQAEKYDSIIEILKLNGAKINNSTEKRNIISFRNPNLPSANNNKGVYDDTTFVFWKDKNGDKRVEKFITNTDPNGLFTGDRPNGDFGRIKSGKTYTYGFSTSSNYGNVLRPIEKLDIERYSKDKEDYQNAKTSLATDKTFLFHKGTYIYNTENLYDKKNPNTFSMGCQTFPDIYNKESKTWQNQYNKFWETMDGNNKASRQKEIYYTILDI